MNRTTKKTLRALIYERAYEIEQALTAHDFMVAKLGGLGTDKYVISEFALKAAMREFKQKFEEFLNKGENDE